MTTWQRFEAEAPGLAAEVRARLEEYNHHVLATLRRDGSPRLSGTEVEFRGPDLTIGMMLGAVKARDLRRDPRYALHTNPGEASMEEGDAKLSGVAVEVTDPAEFEALVGAEAPAGSFDLFLLRLDRVTLTAVRNDVLIIESWRPGEPRVRYERMPNGPAVRIVLRS
ncbi:pyridoxamine 5'-phosphate oxidase family protein [Amycolatopsis cihanbeyliensis]|uniref:Pyridoxamine 5'-phosphate oxidase n=1 Tax=Amycolatopsis cihanbeyliensis TaxID=1128664 RepID=A0A542DDK1_AMYCI|nr:pyridoxamine 5'-phosphate oxidase family protein [Amycolatopsis cihanbeyliensis]TQJ01136.1 pyridoxamine 5'-phosphate oxidase [Amycolatopsis cihanbeyliensis]